MNILTLFLSWAIAASVLPKMPQAPPQTSFPLITLAPDKEADIVLDLKLPAGWRLNPEQWFIYRIAETSGQIKVDMKKRKGYLLKPRFPIKIPFTPGTGSSAVKLQVAFYYCPKDNLDDCKSFSRYYLFPVTSDPQAKTKKIPLLVDASAPEKD